MKVALVHDYIKEYGGAERVLEALHEIWPDAPVFTTVFLPSYLGPHKERFLDWDIHTSFLEYLPFKAKFISPIRLIAPLIFLTFNFRKYDVVIVSATGAYTPNMIRKQTAKQICYCHTPPRYLYGFATARDFKKNMFLRPFTAVMTHVLRIVDGKSSERVDAYIANSHNTEERIKKFYRKTATVIYPPVDGGNTTISGYNDTKRTKEKARNIAVSKYPHIKNYYLAGGRLARPKHIDLIVRTCTALALPLKVFGKAFAGYGEELQKIAGPTIEFVGEVSDAEKLQLMKGAKAFLFAAEDEDFGITPVEAMGVGTPVIAYKSGGVKESIIDGKTGIFFDELTVKSLEKAIQQYNNSAIKSIDCIKQAERFSKERFKREIKAFVEEQLSS